MIKQRECKLIYYSRDLAYADCGSILVGDSSTVKELGLPDAANMPNFVVDIYNIGSAPIICDAKSIDTLCHAHVANLENNWVVTVSGSGSGVGSTHQQAWLNYADTPIQAAKLPYQMITLSSGTTRLHCWDKPVFVTDNTLAAYTVFKLTGNAWVLESVGDPINRKNTMTLVAVACNYDVYTTASYTNKTLSHFKDLGIKKADIEAKLIGEISSHSHAIPAPPVYVQRMYAPLTNGDINNTELLFAGGDVVMGEVV